MSACLHLYAACKKSRERSLLPESTPGPEPNSTSKHQQSGSGMLRKSLLQEAVRPACVNFLLCLVVCLGRSQRRADVPPFLTEVNLCMGLLTPTMVGHSDTSPTSQWDTSGFNSSGGHVPHGHAVPARWARGCQACPPMVSSSHPGTSCDRCLPYSTASVVMAEALVNVVFGYVAIRPLDAATAVHQLYTGIHGLALHDVSGTSRAAWTNFGIGSTTRSSSCSLWPEPDAFAALFWACLSPCLSSRWPLS